MTTLSTITPSLDSLAAEGIRWLRKTRFRDSLRKRLPGAIALFLVIPLLALVVGAAGWAVGQPWKVPTGWTLAVWPLPTVLYLSWHLGGLWKRRPTRSQGLAVFDERFGLKDRLQTADEFLSVKERTPFMEAAVLDVAPALITAGGQRLDWQWGVWSEFRRLAILLVLAVVLVLVSIFLPPSSRLTATSPEELIDRPVESSGGQALTSEQRAEAAGERPTGVSEPKEKEREDLEEKALQSSKGRPTPPKKSESPPSQIAGRERISLGESEGGQTSQATSSGRSGQSRGAPGSQAPSSLPNEKPLVPKKKTPKQPEKDKTSERKRKKLEDKSGATAGRGSSSGSSRNPASTDWSSKDRTEESDNEEFEQEEDVDDDDNESEARGGLQPSLRDRRPPVNRDLSIGFGNRFSPDANGRGGPGDRKKSRGVAALVLGVPVPDHVKGQPNPGRVKINQERVQPQPEDSPAAEAEDRGRRSSPAGRFSGRPIDQSIRRVVSTLR